MIPKPAVSFPRLADAPDGFGTVVGDEERPVEGDGYTDRTAPDVAIVYDESGHEIFVFSAGMAGLVKRHANQFIANANGFVPGAMFGGEDVACIFRRKLLAVVEGQLQGCVVRIQNHVGCDDFGF